MSARSPRVCVYVICNVLYIYIYIYTHRHIYIYICIHIYIHTHVYIHMYTNVSLRFRCSRFRRLGVATCPLGLMKRHADVPRHPRGYVRNCRTMCQEGCCMYHVYLFVNCPCDIILCDCIVYRSMAYDVIVYDIRMHICVCVKLVAGIGSRHQAWPTVVGYL